MPVYVSLAIGQYTTWVATIRFIHTQHERDTHHTHQRQYHEDYTVPSGFASRELYVLVLPSGNSA
jgi:hypothetical protein